MIENQQGQDSSTPEATEQPAAEAAQPAAQLARAWQPPADAPAVEEKPRQEQPRPKNTAQPRAAVVSAVPAGTRVSVAALDQGRFPRRSASVEAVQRRLLELGHSEAGSDPRGRLLEHTRAALEAFRASRGKRLASASAAELVEALFEGTGVDVDASGAA